MSLNGFPCITDGCMSVAEDGHSRCVTCHDRNGYPEGWSRQRDEAWLDYRACHEIRFVPIEGPGCNSHPITPRPDICPSCSVAMGAVQQVAA